MKNITTKEFITIERSEHRYEFGVELSRAQVLPYI